MVQLLRDRLPLASSLCRLNVHGPSKCSYCKRPHEESIDHVFSEGELARGLWSFFWDVARMSYIGAGVRVRLSGWWLQPRRNGFVDHIVRKIPSLICWREIVQVLKGGVFLCRPFSIASCWIGGEGA